jgi:hypothetical protein
VELDSGCINLAKLELPERRSQRLQSGFVGLMRFGRANRRFGIVFQEEIDPVIEGELFAFPDNVQRVVVASLKAIS